MLLVINIGNSSTVIGLFNNGKLFKKYRFKTNGSSSHVALAVKIMPFLCLYDIKVNSIIDVVISCTVPYLVTIMSRFCKNYLDKQIILAQRLKHNLNIEIINPQELGVDILVNCFAVSQIYKTDCIIVDLGTALTFSAITRCKKFLGVCITNGIQSAINGLNQDTATLLFNDEISKPCFILGKTTQSAINSGIFHSYISIIEGIVKKIRTEYCSQTFKIILTGGFSHIFHGHIQYLNILDEDLILKGLSLLYEFNQQK